MKLKYAIEKTVDVDVIQNQHAVVGDIITPICHGSFDPCFVVADYFEQRYIDKYGYGSKELLHNGTNYVDCIRFSDGRTLRLQYYEYAIIANAESYKQAFIKKYPSIAAAVYAPEQNSPQA